jgi:hypothetical protein
MPNKFDEELRDRYINDYNVDIEYMGVDELLQKSKTSSTKKIKLTYRRAALEKITRAVKQEYKDRTIRRVRMDTLLKNFLKTGSMQIVWKAYLLHVEKNIDLPDEFQRRLKEEMIKIAETAIGEDNEKFTKIQRNKYIRYNHILKRSEILHKLIDEGLKVGMPKAYVRVANECQDPENPLYDPLMDDVGLKGLYRGLYNEQQIRPPKKID